MTFGSKWISKRLRNEKAMGFGPNGRPNLETRPTKHALTCILWQFLESQGTMMIIWGSNEKILVEPWLTMMMSWSLKIWHRNKLMNHAWTKVANGSFFDQDETLIPWWTSLDYDPLSLLLLTWDQSLLKSIFHTLIRR